MSFFVEVAIMLTQLVFGLLLLVVCLRILLPLSAVRFSNPICQAIYKSTNPVIGPLTGLLPAWRKLSLAALLLGFVLMLIETLILLVLIGFPIGMAVLLSSSIGGLLYLMLGLCFWAIVIRALLSWFSPDYGHPAVEVLFAITDPLLRPFRRLPPRSAGFDLSPMYAGFALRVLMLLVEHVVGNFGILLQRL